MAKDRQTRSLFEVIAVKEDREKPREQCPHRFLEKTRTVWPGENFDRLTWTCRSCGELWGRA